MPELTRPDPSRYSRSVAWSEADDEFVALSQEFPGLSGVGETQAKALAALDDAISMAIEIAEEDGEPLPQPRMMTEHSGQFRVRLPRSLHASLTELAAAEGMSLNTIVATLLGQRIGELAAYTRARNEVRDDLRAFAGSFAQATAQQVSAVVQASMSTSVLGADDVASTPVVMYRSSSQPRPEAYASVN